MGHYGAATCVMSALNISIIHLYDKPSVSVHMWILTLVKCWMFNVSSSVQHTPTHQQLLFMTREEELISSQLAKAIWKLESPTDRKATRAEWVNIQYLWGAELMSGAVSCATFLFCRLWSMQFFKIKVPEQSVSFDAQVDDFTFQTGLWSSCTFNNIDKKILSVS